MTVDSAGLAARQLGDIRILLLRHDRAAGCKGVVERHVPDLARRPPDKLLAKARAVHRTHRAPIERSEDEVAIGNRIHAVPRYASETQILRDEGAINRI